MKRFSLIFFASIMVLGGALIEAQSLSAGTAATAPGPFPTPKKSLKDANTNSVSPEFPSNVPLTPEHVQPLPQQPGKYSSKLKEQPYVLMERGSEGLPQMVDQTQIIEQVIRDQLKALNEGDPSRAYYAFGSNEFKKSVSLETFKQFVTSNRILFVHRTIEMGKPTFKGIAAQVKVKITSGNEVVRTEYELVLEDGFWKVNRLEILRNDF